MRGAADKLDVAPSAVSRQISLLEVELAVPLLERHKRGVTLTEGGRLLIEYYREQRSYQDDVLSKLQELRGMRRGHVSIATGEGFVWDLMSGPLKHFCTEFPDISLSLDIASNNEVMRKVSEDEAEIGLSFNPQPDPKIISRAICKQPVRAIVHPDSPLLHKKRPIAIADLLDYPQAMTNPSFGLRQLMNVVEHSEKIRFSPVLTTNSFVILKQFVQLQLGVALLPMLVVAEEVNAGELIAIPTAQPLLENAEVHLVTRTGRKLSVAASKMMQYMTRRMHAFNENL
jgi:DNA-binding transcriptional LysR family regulator